MAHLTLVLDNREVRKFVLSKGVTTIGRAQDNDIVINNLALSRRHAQVEWKNGGYQVVDLESQNGVFVNNRRVQPASELRDEDTIMLGTYQFVFREDGDDAGRDRPEVYTRQKVKAVATPSRPPPPPEPPAESVDEEEDCPLLILKYNDMELQRHVVRQDESLVGRAKECDIQIPERRLSRRHCAIVRGEAGRYFVKDLGSQNGTYVNRRRIKGLCEIKDGDVLNFAEYTVSFLSSMAEYSGPDSVHVRSPAARRAGPDDDRARVAKGGFRSSSEVAFKDTMMPRAYRDEPRPDEEPPGEEAPDEESAESAPSTPPPRARPSVPPPRPSDLGEPLIDPPDRARKKRVQLRSEPPAPPPSAVPAPRKRPRTDPPAPAPSPRKAADPAKKRPPPVRRDDEADVDDPAVESRPEPEMRDWYAARAASRLYDPIPEVAGARDEVEEEEDLASARSQSSISQILDPMTVNKQELEDNLRADANERRFYVEVQHGPKTLYSGPLLKPVTILGTDPDAEIRLKGRFVAGRHSILVRVRDSLLLVRLGSSSAARVNGLPKLQAFLKTGDVVQIDETTIRITEE